MAMKTPGVYIVEKNAFPNSVVEVATAVPAFIGYTQKAVNDGTTLATRPWRITSMAKYEHYFGGAPEPVFTVQESPLGVKAALPDMVAARGQAASFKAGNQDVLLARAAGKAGGRFLMHQAMRHFFQNGGGPCCVVSVGDYSAELAAGDTHSGLIGGLTPLLQEQEPTMVVVPDAVLLSRADCAAVQAAVLQHCGLDMRNRFAILDVWGGECSRQHDGGDCIDAFRADVGSNFLSFAAAYYPWLHTTLVQAGEVDFGMLDSASRKTLAHLIAKELKLADAPADDKKALAAKAMLADLANDDSQPELATAPHRSQLHMQLLWVSTLYAKLMGEALGLLNLMPPAAAMAGLYTMVDNTRGVWKAPANISVAGAVAPAVDISHDDQEDLNVTLTGKSINAIRSFVGEGVLVWGARTLDGNSLDWRYIHVRRTVCMLEDSCRLAAQAMVFEPNVANTWMSIQSTISNYLTSVWKRGGLAGAVPDEAFSVHVGLGDTMTPQDLLDGILRVTVLVAISRPAEFIEFTFQQQMQQA